MKGQITEDSFFINVSTQRQFQCTICEQSFRLISLVWQRIRRLIQMINCGKVLHVEMHLNIRKDILASTPYIICMNICVVARRKRGLVAKLFIEIIDQQIIKVS